MHQILICFSLIQPVGTCCLFLAGKAEETPKKCRDIIRTMRQLTNDRQFETFGVDPREEIMALERVLLQVIISNLKYLTYINGSFENFRLFDVSVCT